MILNVEADEIGYRCAFACEKKAYILRTSGGTVRDYGIKYTKTKIMNSPNLKGRKLGVDYELEMYKVIEPDYIVSHTLDKMVAKLHDVIIPGVCKKVTEVKLWLSPSNHSNFRYSVVNIPGQHGLGYKEGRSEKPKHIQMIRNRLIKEWGATEIEGYEADDALGIYQTDNTIAVHIDKDIDMVPGHHYNHVSGEYYFVPNDLGYLKLKEKVNKKGHKSYTLKGHGLKFFYAQMMMGDSTDNIPGIKGFGPKTTYDTLYPMTTEDECFSTIYNSYHQRYGSMNVHNAICEMADLLWICRNDRLTGRQYLKSKGWL